MNEDSQPETHVDRTVMTRFLSISVDVSGSTQAKVALQQFALKHGRSLEAAHAAFGEALIATEARFLSCLRHANAGRHEPIPLLERIFLIKTIGDEFWYAYDVNDLDDFELGQHARLLLMCMLGFLSKAPFSAFLGDREETHPDGLDEFEEVVREALGSKITFDLVQGHDIGKKRQEKIEGVLAEALHADGTPFDADKFIKLLDRAGGLYASASRTPGKVTVSRRSDYIGTEIDRFFRLTGKSQPGCILIGQTLEPHLALERVETPAGEIGWGVYWLRDKFRNGGMTTMHLDVRATALFPFHDLRGVAGPYAGMLCKDRHSYVERQRPESEAAERFARSKNRREADGEAPST